MINLHCHTYFSDGVLGPAELLARCVALNYRAVAITDHIDESNFEAVIKSVKKVIIEFNKSKIIKALCGVELTYVLPQNISKIAKECRKLGAEIIVVHGETLVEPVPADTNLRAAECKLVDILAHPGLITPAAIKAAVKNNVCLEITSRKGHSLSNGYVANLATLHNAKLVLNTDAHEPSDLITKDFAKNVLLAAGIENNRINDIFKNSEILAFSK